MGTGVYGSCGITHITPVLSKIYYLRAVSDKPRDAVVKYDTYRTYSGIARSSLR